jgi:hypothetical protein
MQEPAVIEFARPARTRRAQLFFARAEFEAAMVEPTTTSQADAARADEDRRKKRLCDQWWAAIPACERPRFAELFECIRTPHVGQAVAFCRLSPERSD